MRGPRNKRGGRTSPQQLLGTELGELEVSSELSGARREVKGPISTERWGANTSELPLKGGLGEDETKLKEGKDPPWGQPRSSTDAC